MNLEDLLDLFGLEEVHNYRDCAECGRPLIDVIFKDPLDKIRFPFEPKVDDICVACAAERLGLN